MLSKQIFYRKYFFVFPPLVLGIFASFSFPLFDLNILIYPTLIFLFYGFLKLNTKDFFSHFIYGFIFIFTFYFFYCFWITKVSQIGDLGLVALILLCLYQQIFYILFFYALYKIKISIIYEKKYFFILLPPFFWVLVEYLKSLGFMGFSWGIIGYSQYKFLPLIQIAEWTGVYGVSFLIILLTFCITFFLYNNRVGKWYLLFALSIFIANYIYGAHLIKKNKFINKNNKLNISIAQIPLPKDINWNNNLRNDLLNQYLNLSKTAKKSELIIWPETVIPLGYLDDGFLKQKLSLDAKFLHKILIAGVFDVVKNNNYNTAVVFSKNGNLLAKYYKNKLVPFGEKVPFRNLFLKFGYNPWGEGSADLSSGKIISPVFTPIATIGFNICYETTFTYISREMTKKGADFIVALVADSWFPKSTTYQHTSMFIFRAIENRRFLVRSADVGISAFIDSNGKIYKKINPHENYLLQGEIYKSKIKTFYTNYGDVFAKSCVLICLVFMIFLFIHF